MGHAGLVNFMTVSVALLLVGLAVLLLTVQFELGPASGLSRPRKWALTLILGSGMVAFSIKLAIIFTLVNFSEQTLRRNITPPQPALQVDWERLNEGAPKIKLSVMQKAYVWRTLPERAPAPAWNPTTPEKVALGERLFHDPSLSVDGTISCSSCHDVRGGAGEDHRSGSLGVGGQVGGRNAPTVWNAGFQSVLFWDGRAPSLEEQAKGPPTNPAEMGMPSLQAVEQRVRNNPAYREPFALVFGAAQPITIREITAAIAAYERTLIAADTPYDRFVRGDEKALNAAQLRGMALFQQVGCILCHSGPNFSAASVFDPPQAAQRIFPVFNSAKYEARYKLTRDVGANAPGSAQGVWRVPSLRNVALTAPYFHNGSVDSLTEAVRIMATVQRGKRIGDDLNDKQTLIWSNRDKTLARIEAAPLSERDVADIVEFLKSLSSDTLRARSRTAPSGT